MAKTIKIVEKCSRCPRDQEKVVTIEEAIKLAKEPEPKYNALVVVIDGEEVAKYKFLCDSCRDIVLGYTLSAARKPEKKSSRRVVRKKKKEQAPEATPAVQKR